VSNLSLDDLIKSLLAAKPKSPNVRIIAIDGPAGAGKSTLAKRIKSNLQEQSGLKTVIVHMDDLYDGWENALTDQLTKTLINQILIPVSLSKNFGYRKYNWLSGNFGEFFEEESPEILILEGVGSGQRATRKYLDHLIWIDIDAETGLQRVLQRDGDYLENEMRVWQMRESSHFSMENTRDSATIRINGSFFI
jgi:uridine kinase